jgi:putative redox protein
MQDKVVFQSADGNELAGVIHRPDAGQPRAWALFAHCFTCTKNIKAAVNIADSMCEEGFAVLRFDFTGLGHSEGKFADTHFSSNVGDLLAAAAYLETEHQAPAVLAGHSLGGTACLAAAHDMPSVKAVATMGSPADAEHVLHLLENDLDTIEQKGEALVRLAGRPFTIRQDFLDDVRSQSVRDGIRSLRRALLVMHSPIDELVPIEEAGNIYSAALHPKSFITLDQSDHLMSNERDSRYAGKVLANWASHYIEDDLDELESAPYEPGAVVARGSAEDIFRVVINADGHRQFGDEPESFGGQDTGPTPYDYLSTALATCTVMTLNMYARRKRLSLETVQVSVRHGKIHAADCVDCETRTGKIDRFDKQIFLDGQLDDQQRQRLLEIADRCPVHQTLHKEVEIRTTLGS